MKSWTCQDADNRTRNKCTEVGPGSSALKNSVRNQVDITLHVLTNNLWIYVLRANTVTWAWKETSQFAGSYIIRQLGNRQLESMFFNLFRSKTMLQVDISTKPGILASTSHPALGGCILFGESTSLCDDLQRNPTLLRRYRVAQPPPRPRVVKKDNYTCGKSSCEKSQG